MPSETRRLIFSQEELIVAISEYNMVSKENKLPAGSIVSCQLLSEPEVVVRLQLVDQRSGEPREIDLMPEVIGAALLRYCMNRGIPVPKRAAKAIQVHDGRISLNMRLTIGPNAPVDRAAPAQP